MRRLTVPTCYGYDGCGDLTAVYGRDGKKLRGFAYRNHIMTEHSQPDGRSINYLYYGSGHLHQINLDGETVSDIERDKLHQEISRSQGTLTSRYDYDPMGRLKNQRTIYGDNRKQSALIGSAVNRRYAYDKAGNLIQTADQRSGVLDYVYDKIGRIESATNKQTGSSEKFSFDPANNILSDGLKDKGRVKGTNIGSGNRLKEYNGTEYTYDALGNLIYRQLPNGENQYFVYDTENQLTRAEIKKPAGNTEIWEYAYDPFGRRLSKERKDKLAWVSTEPKRTHFVWDGSRLLQEYTYKGDYTYIYTDQNSYEPLAQVFYNGKDDKQYLAYFHNDQIGIPREMTDQFGNLLWYGEYTAWGRLKKDERVYKEAHQPFRLQNQYLDSETGLHYNFFRYYEPDTGRFINQDPIGLLGNTNLYYFSPNSILWTDPLGLSPRNLPGIATGQGRLIGNKWLKGTHGNAGAFPRSVAEQLRGRTFASFDDFRAAFWQEVAKDPDLNKDFSKSNRRRMAQGKAPKVSVCQTGKNGSGSYVIHHKTPIQHGGGVYDMDNMMIMTPRFHDEILSTTYHFGKG